MNTQPFQKWSAFFEELEKLKKSFCFESEEEEKKFYKKNSYLFATTSASLFRLLPQIPYSEHKSIFEKLLFNLQLLTLEENYADQFIQNCEIIDTENTIDKAQNGQPFLFCCFHTGAYSLIPALLANKNLNFGFLSNKTLTERKGKHFIEIHQNYCEKHSLNSTVQLINVEETKGIWQAIRMLKEGKSLVVYTDGNTGSNYSKKESQNTVNSIFLGENLRVRQGVAFLSYACNVPIVPILSSRIYEEEKDTLKRKFEFLPSIYPPNFGEKSSTKSKISKEEFVEQTMQKLYSILEKEVTKDTSELVNEWEGWIFVNKFFEDLQRPILGANKKENSVADIDLTERKNSNYIFNEERFALIENQKKTLFDKFTYRFFPVSELLYEIIIYFSVPKKLYLLDNDNEEADKEAINSSHSPNFSISTTSDSTLIHSDSKLDYSKTLFSITTLEKLIEKGILVQFK